MSRSDCISNRNIKIIITYVRSRLGTSEPIESLLEDLPYPADEHPSPEDFFLNEDEWTTYENFEQIFRRAKALVGEQDFYFKCGASSAKLRSWGRFHHFVRVFSGPNDGFRRLPFFNRNLDDTKEIRVILPPKYDTHLKKIRTVLKIDFHEDFDANRDYIGDPYLRGIISSIPTIWGLAPATIEQPLKPYDPEKLFNREPEFLPYRLGVEIDGEHMRLREPASGKRQTVGEKVLLIPEEINGKKVFLGKYAKSTPSLPPDACDYKEAILITRGITADGRVLLRPGDIYLAPYFILDITYNRSFFFRRLLQLFKLLRYRKDSGNELIDTINQLRKSIKAKNEAYVHLERTNEQLRKAKAQLDQYAQGLEKKVEERTAELRRAQEDLLELNRDLEQKVHKQVAQLERYNELRRYLSPKLTDKILAGGHAFGLSSQRKMMTVVFTDIRDFSMLTDGLEPEETFALLNSYLPEMIKIVHHYDGTLNKMIGDGLLIFFGDPIAMDDHAQRAVRMATDMQRKVEELKEEWSQYGYQLGVGIGINTGFVTVGNIGSDTHRDYTVIGNQVNVAARLQARARAGEILISHRTFSKVKGMVEVDEMGDMTVKGIHSPVTTYRVLW